MLDKPSTYPSDHAVDFSRRYARGLDYHAAQTMLDLGIPADRIGDSDFEHGIRHAAFHPHRKEGGTIAPDGRIILDSGVMNPEQLTGMYGEEAGTLWARSRLRPRMQAVVAHEHAEHETGSHEAALKAAPETELPISHEARRILRAMELGWQR